MPTLLDKIKGNLQQVKRGTQLFDVVNESVTNQAKRQGMPLGGAVSPLLAAGMGVSEDQAKMAGTKAQLDNVQRQTIAQAQQQVRMEERAQARTEKTEQEKQREAQASSLAKLGANVQQIVKTAMATSIQGATEKMLPSYLNMDKWKAAIPDETRRAVLEPVLLSALGGTATQQELALLANAPELAVAKATEPDQMAKNVMAAIEAFRATEANAAIKSAQIALPDNFLLSSLDANQISALGFTTKEAMLSALGLVESAANPLTIKDLQNAVERIQQADYTEVKGLQDAINDPTLSPAARKEAMNRLRELGSAGVRATEEDFAKLTDAVDASDTITIDGQQMTIAELLSDEGLSSVIKAYFTDADYAKELQSASPELVEFINKHKDALMTASKNLSDGTTKLANTQAENAKLSKGHETPDGAVSISDDFNKAVFGDNWGKVTDTVFQPTEAHRILQGNYDIQWQRAYSDLLTSLAKSDPEMAKTFANYNYDQLKAAGLTKNADAMIRYQKYLKTATNFKQATDNKDPEQAIRALFPTIDAKGGLQEFVTKAYHLNRSGLLGGISAGILAILDPDNNGIIDNWDQIAPKLNELFFTSTTGTDGKKVYGGPKTPLDITNGLVPNLEDMVQTLQTQVEGIEKSNQGLAAAISNDGILDQNEVNKLTTGMTLDNLNEFVGQLKKYTGPEYKIQRFPIKTLSGATKLLNLAEYAEYVFQEKRERDFQNALVMADIPYGGYDKIGDPSKLEEIKQKLMTAKKASNSLIGDKFDQLLKRIDKQLSSVKVQPPTLEDTVRGSAYLPYIPGGS